MKQTNAQESKPADTDLGIEIIVDDATVANENGSMLQSDNRFLYSNPNPLRETRKEIDAKDLSVQSQYEFLPIKTQESLANLNLDLQARTDEISKKDGYFTVENSADLHLRILYNFPGKFLSLLKEYVSETEKEMELIQRATKTDDQIKKIRRRQHDNKVIPAFEFFSKLSETTIDDKSLMSGPLDPSKDEITRGIRKALEITGRYRDVLVEKSGLGEEVANAYSPAAIYGRLLKLSSTLEEMKSRNDVLLNSKGMKYVIANERFIENLDISTIDPKFQSEIESIRRHCQGKINALLAPPSNAPTNFHFSKLEETLESSARFFYNGVLPNTPQTAFYAGILYEAMNNILNNKESPRDYLPLSHMNKHKIPGIEFFNAVVNFLEQKIIGGTNENNEPKF